MVIRISLIWLIYLLVIPTLIGQELGGLTGLDKVIPDGDLIVEGNYTVHLFFKDEKKLLRQKANFKTTCEVPNGRIKIEYSPRISAWHNGIAPYIEQYTVSAFNGNYWLRALSKSGYDGNFAIKNEATILKDPPTFTSWNYESGLCGLLPFWKVQQQFSLLAFLKNPELVKDGTGDYDISVEANGDIKLKFTFGDLHKQGSRETLIFSQSKGYMLMSAKQEIEFTNGEPRSITDWFSDEQKNTGGWHWSSKHTLRHYLNGVKDMGVMEVVSTISRCEFVNKKSDAYDIKLEPGWHVRDRRFETSRGQTSRGQTSRGQADIRKNINKLESF